MSEALETFLARFDEIGKNQFIWGGSGSAGQDVRYAASVIRQQRMAIAELVVALANLLERIDKAGGLGPYTDGPVFVIKRAEELISRYGSKP